MLFRVCQFLPNPLGILIHFLPSSAPELVLPWARCSLPEAPPLPTSALHLQWQHQQVSQSTLEVVVTCSSDSALLPGAIIEFPATIAFLPLVLILSLFCIHFSHTGILLHILGLLRNNLIASNSFAHLKTLTKTGVLYWQDLRVYNKSIGKIPHKSSDSVIQLPVGLWKSYFTSQGMISLSVKWGYW